MPDLGRLKLTCPQCQIPFLSPPGNRGRTDIRCPFGCRIVHRQRGSSARSRAYYQTPQGKIKKKEQNAKRKARDPPQAKSKASRIIPVAYLQFLLKALTRRESSRSEVLALCEAIELGLSQHPLENPVVQVKMDVSGK